MWFCSNLNELAGFNKFERRFSKKQRQNPDDTASSFSNKHFADGTAAAAGAKSPSTGRKSKSQGQTAPGAGGSSPTPKRSTGKGVQIKDKDSKGSVTGNKTIKNGGDGSSRKSKSHERDSK